MQRGSDKHSPRMDDTLAAEVDGMVTGTGSTHAEEGKDPEPAADDDPELAPGHPVGDRFAVGGPEVVDGDPGSDPAAALGPDRG